MTARAVGKQMQRQELASRYFLFFPETRNLGLNFTPFWLYFLAAKFQPIFNFLTQAFIEGTYSLTFLYKGICSTSSGCVKPFEC